MSKKIKIMLNGFQESVPEQITISSLISRCDEQDVHLIVERNGQFVFPQDYSSTMISEGDRLEFINPNFGG